MLYRPGHWTLERSMTIMGCITPPSLCYSCGAMCCAAQLCTKKERKYLLMRSLLRKTTVFHWSGSTWVNNFLVHCYFFNPDIQVSSFHFHFWHCVCLMGHCLYSSCNLPHYFYCWCLQRLANKMLSTIHLCEYSLFFLLPLLNINLFAYRVTSIQTKGMGHIVNFTLIIIIYNYKTYIWKA